MATAYAAFTSLMQLITQLHEHPRPPTKLDDGQIHSLTSNIRFFQKLMEDHHSTIAAELEMTFADAALLARDTIDDHITIQTCSQVNLYQSLEKAIHDLDLIEKQVMDEQSRKGDNNQQPNSGEKTVVGIEDMSAKIMDKFTPIISTPAYKFHRRQVDSLCSKIRFLQGFLEDHSGVDRGFKIRIADAAHAAETHIEAHVADRISEQEEVYTSLQSAIECFDFMRKDVMNEQSQQRNNHQPNRRPLASSRSPSAENIVVGIEDKATRIMEKLTSHHKADRQIVSISGMGGIGKTTLARKVYENPYVKNYFDIRAWATISKDFDIHKSLVELLICCLDNPESNDRLSEKSEHDLGEQLYKSLYGKRYLIILDDVWSVEAWERLRSAFPASSGSGIVITSRESTLFASISSLNFSMDFLGEHESWDLLCKTTFGNDNCPDELEGVGKKIAKKCRGLPLSIVVIGGHLAKSPLTREYWESVADNLSSVVNSEDNEHCLKILSLSYACLPVHLKACFLHMGSFLRDGELWVPEVIKLWEVEGILKPISGKSLKDTAGEYLNDLIARNLVLASKSSSITGELKSCRVHDLLRDLCSRVSKERIFTRIVQRQYLYIREANEDLQISISKLCSPTNIRTLTLRGESLLVRELLKVLPLGGGRLNFGENALDFNDVVNLERLEVVLDDTSEIPFIVPPIFFLWNLQSLVIRVRSAETKVPPEIWEMPQLRHIKISDHLSLPNPPSESSDILKNLQSAKTILNLNFSEDLIRRVPNIKKLKVIYDEGAYCLNNISRLEKLESLDCSLPRKLSKNPNPTFPHSLKKLTFSSLHWDDVTTNIGSLPLVEVLNLSNCSGREWNLEEGGFVRLKYLKLSHCHDLQCFTAEANQFPSLQKLVMMFMDCLKEISSEVGDIPTLRSIKLRFCPDSAVVSAKEIGEAQYDAGNEGLQVKALLHVDSRLSPDMSSSNFHVESFL